VEYGNENLKGSAHSTAVPGVPDFPGHHNKIAGEINLFDEFTEIRARPP
jgi:hypothetical protein